ncbi:IBR/half ring-finger domain containing protein [Nitzschia inconspicua]|uniref:IBR/half ring-finger domain containing protein n=1 Tax=Nitzschia inconspicua TaxID=303405 RepID=A0A9K3PHV2_9STRA|nr:IBR/half ring-finger domain containing protein [Nitzschia inconspicua]
MSSTTLPTGSADDDRNKRIVLDVPTGESLSTCPICYELFYGSSSPNADFRVGVPLGTSTDEMCHPKECFRIPNCEHEFCRECLALHCQHSISIRKVPIECPAKASEQCEETLPVSLIQALLHQHKHQESSLAPPDTESGGSDTCSEEAPSSSGTLHTVTSSLTNRYGSLDEACEARKCNSLNFESEQEMHWREFQRLHRLFMDKNLTPCTRCQEPVTVLSSSEALEQENTVQVRSNRDLRLKSQSSFEPITCLECGHSFCQVHGDAHPGMSCDEYLQLKIRPDEQVQKSERVIRQYCKPCSHCEAPIYKASGCDHIICPSCNNDMCFKCGTHRFLDGESMVRNCQKCNQSFIDHRYIGLYRLLICLAMPLYLPFYVLHVVVVGALALISCGCFCCLCCGIQKKTRINDKREECRDCEPCLQRWEDQYDFHPRIGTQTVLSMVFLPFIDLFNQCGISCCTRISRPTNDFEGNDVLESDEEHRIQPTLTMSTIGDVDG